VVRCQLPGCPLYGNQLGIAPVEPLVFHESFTAKSILFTAATARAGGGNSIHLSRENGAENLLP
jgi:hypothetical protein